MTRYVNHAFAMTFAVALLAFVPAGPAFAAGGDSDSSSPATPASPPNCPAGQVWDPEAKRLFGKGKCVAEADLNKDGKQSLIYDYGKALADAGEYQQAIDVLKMAPNQHDPRVLNYLGFSNRKLDRMDVALGYYKSAIAMNPDFSLVREYLGEAYIQLGMLENAREQLSEIERICGGRECGEYNQLAELIVESQLEQQ